MSKGRCVMCTLCTLYTVYFVHCVHSIHSVQCVQCVHSRVTVLVHYGLLQHIVWEVTAHEVNTDGRQLISSDSASIRSEH